MRSDRSDRLGQGGHSAASETTRLNRPAAASSARVHSGMARRAFRHFGRDKRHANGRKFAARGYLSARVQSERKPFGRLRSEVRRKVSSRRRYDAPFRPSEIRVCLPCGDPLSNCDRS
ncbi:hypothetical protein OH76DRAFT_853308 [Lentinus brumalis]|uniref:Uncharacterized protein n=1 Tax=Lentinus brumalis TaxID=2498619 RepID=A0A371DQY2_9APHY|nr:hypothetical protein OH76DRAFT_853308 [Polyporus brumalis]